MIAVRSIVTGHKGGKEEALRIKNFKDFYTGILFMLFGAAFTWGATRYAMGTAAKMGPGYLPFILGGLLTVLGVIIFTRSLVSASEDSRVGRFAVKASVLMFGSIAAFALLLRTAGLVVSIFAIILISEPGEPRVALQGDADQRDCAVRRQPRHVRVWPEPADSGVADFHSAIDQRGYPTHPWNCSII